MSLDLFKETKVLKAWGENREKEGYYENYEQELKEIWLENELEENLDVALRAIVKFAEAVIEHDIEVYGFVFGSDIAKILVGTPIWADFDVCFIDKEASRGEMFFWVSTRCKNIIEV